MNPGAAPDPLIGSLCSGYGGLDLGVQAALGGSLAWHAEVDPNASRILARHWPGVPNLADITAVEWSAVPKVDVLTAGFPCQRRLGRRPPRRTQPRNPLRAVAARRACSRSPPAEPGGDRECPRSPLRTRRYPWRRGILPVVSGRRPSRPCFAGTWCRSRRFGRHRVRRALARASRQRRRSTPPSRAHFPRRLARRLGCRHRRRVLPGARTRRGRTWATSSPC